MRFPVENECLYMPTKSAGTNCRSGVLQPPSQHAPFLRTCCLGVYAVAPFQTMGKAF